MEQSVTTSQASLAASQEPLVKRNLDLLAHGSASSDFMLICAQKLWYIHKHIVEPVPDETTSLHPRSTACNVSIYQVRRARLRANRFDRSAHDIRVHFGQITFNAKYEKTQYLLSAIYANVLGNQYGVPEYARAGEIAFEGIKSSLILRLNHNSRHLDYANAVIRTHSRSDIETTASVFAGARKLVQYPYSLSPCFEAWIVNWLVNSVGMLGAVKSVWHFRELDMSLNSLAVKAKLRRDAAGIWMPPKHMDIIAFVGSQVKAETGRNAHPDAAGEEELYELPA